MTEILFITLDKFCKLQYEENNMFTITKNSFESLSGKSIYTKRNFQIYYGTDEH